MRIWRFSASCVLLSVALTLAVQTRILAASSVPAPSDKKDQAARPQPTSEGERAFRQNCSRCHQAPQNFPPEISSTIVRHMRVRASLSREDERAILKYLNP
jgi:cytochrome c5